mgnify:CR=1 FL=1
MPVNFTGAMTVALCVACAATAVAASDNLQPDLLDPIRVEGEWLTPAMSVINPQKLSTGRESAEALRDLSTGFHEISRGTDFTTVFISERDGARLFLVFDG